MKLNRDKDKKQRKIHICECGRIFTTTRSYSKHKYFCKPYLKNRERILSKEFFDLYCGQKNMPNACIVNDILKNKFNYGEVAKRARKFGYKALSRSEAMKNPYTQANHKKTIRKRYGVDYISQIEEVKEKKVQTMLKNFGVKHNFQLKSQLEKRRLTVKKRYGVNNVSQANTIKKKKAETFYEHYGITNIFKDNEYIKRKTLEKYGTLPGKPSRFANKFFKILRDVLKTIEKEISVTFGHYEYCVHNEDLSELFLLDFVAIYKNKKAAIEFNGDFWHMNPKIYKPTDFHSVMKKSAKEIWLKDAHKKEFLKKEGINSISIWNSEYDENPEKQLEKAHKFICKELQIQ